MPNQEESFAGPVPAGKNRMHLARSPVSMSIFELLKAGPGPSSSHTIGPMQAGVDFAARARKLEAGLLAKARGVRVRLFGSLSATGRGHGTDRAVLAGLLGYEPAVCPPALLNDLAAFPAEKRVLRVGEKTIPLCFDAVVFGLVQHGYPYSNTLLIDLLDIPFPPDEAENGRGAGNWGVFREKFPGTGSPEKPLSERGRPEMYGQEMYGKVGSDPLAEHILFSREYYSVGGGFLQWKGWTPEKRGAPAYPYVNMNELQVRLAESGLPLDELLLANEVAVTGASPEKILEGLDSLLERMKDAVRRGCEARGLLPGAIGLARKAAVLHDRAASLQDFDRRLCLLNAYAYAAAEENAAGNIIVTAPTCGAAGVLPAVLLFMQERRGPDLVAQRKGLLAATVIGAVAKQNAGIAGAEVGCQGEIGVASAMAAAMLAEARGYSAKVVENAAEIALEHHLGLTCDPVGGYVQIPCIERNAMGAVKAYNAALIACNENTTAHLVGFDAALRAMAEIGRDMNSKYKETSTGGLAVCLVAC